MDELILKQYDSEVKAVEGERALNVTITTNTVDRSGDIVEPKGGKLANFRKNPVVLMAHDYQGLPIGKASNLEKTETGINAKVTFPEEGMYPLADTVYNMYKQKFMKAWSIGFIPIKSEDIVDEKDEKKMASGRRFKTWELLEFSACAVPNNPDVSTNMVKKGIDVKLLKEAGLIKVEEKKDKTEEVKEIIKDGLKDVKADPIDPEKVKASIEKDEKEEFLKEYKAFDDMTERFLPVYLAERKQFIISDVLFKELKDTIKDLELKAGAVLNVKNKKDLKDAQALIQSVLDSAGEEEGQEGKEVKDNEKDDIIITITGDKKEDPGKEEAKEEKTIMVDKKLIAETITKTMNHILGITDK